MCMRFLVASYQHGRNVLNFPSKRCYPKKTSRGTMRKNNKGVMLVSVFFIVTLLLSTLLTAECRSGGNSRSEDSHPPFRQLKRRPLNLPVVHKGERCPVTKGDQ